MNPITAGSSVNARNAFRQQYMNTLQLEIANQTKNLNANKLFKQNGTTGSEPPDTRSVTEKYGDIDALKREVRVGLREITDGRESELIVADITTAELQFLAGQLPFIIGDLKPKWKLGVPATSFLPYLRKLMRKNIETEGVEYGLHRPADVGGGAIITAGELIRGEDIQDVQMELDNLEGLTQMDERRIDVLRGELSRLDQLRPTAQDRQIVAELGDPNILAEYDEDVTMASENIPSEEVLFHILRMRPASAVVFNLRDILNAVDFEMLKSLKRAVADIENHVRAFRPPTVYEQESLETPFGEPISYTGIRGSQPPPQAEQTIVTQSARPVRSLNPESELPSDYIQQPTQQQERDYQLSGFAEEVPPETFMEQTYDTKAELLLGYADAGLFNSMDEQFLHMINALHEGNNLVPEGDMDRGYKKFFRLKQMGGLTERRDFRSNRPEFEDELGLGWASLVGEDPIVNPTPPPPLPSRNPPPIPPPSAGERGLMIPLDQWKQLSAPQKSNLVDEMLQAETFDEEEAGYAEALLAESPPQEVGLDHVYVTPFLNTFLK